MFELASSTVPASEARFDAALLGSKPATRALGSEAFIERPKATPSEPRPIIAMSGMPHLKQSWPAG